MGAGTHYGWFYLSRHLQHITADKRFINTISYPQIMTLPL